MNPQNPLPAFQSPEWHRRNAEEIANRPTTHKGPRPEFTGADFEKYRPKDGLKIRFVVGVPGYSAGQVVTLANPRALELCRSGDAVLED